MLDKCKYCKLSFTNKENLKQHLNTDHLDVSYKDRHRYFQSLFTFSRGTKASKKLGKAKNKTKINVGDKYRFKFDKKYRGVLMLLRTKCDNCDVIHDKIWMFKNTNIATEVLICKKCELGINKHNYTKGYLKIIYTPFESKK
ncbi:MAG TPA: hypothetical protein DEG63_06240 [Flavobacteriaceae bacterium]|nr:hypothetical protein [Flavobacteriaceae bacterium]